MNTLHEWMNRWRRLPPEALTTECNVSWETRLCRWNPKYWPWVMMYESILVLIDHNFFPKNWNCCATKVFLILHFSLLCEMICFGVYFDMLTCTLFSLFLGGLKVTPWLSGRRCNQIRRSNQTNTYDWILYPRKLTTRNEATKIFATWKSGSSWDLPLCQRPYTVIC